MASSSSSSPVLKFHDQHNVCGYLQKPVESEGYHEIVDFLSQSHIRFALFVDPIIYFDHINYFWTSAVMSEENGVKFISAKVKGKEVKVSEASIRSYLLLDDADGMECYLPYQIFEQLVLYGYEGENTGKLTYYKQLFSPQWKFFIHTLQHCISQKRGCWEQFSSNLASGLICLASNQKFNISKLIWSGMVNNLSKDTFLMYPRFLQYIIDQELKDDNIPREGDQIKLSNLGKKAFSNMKRKGSVKKRNLQGG